MLSTLDAGIVLLYLISLFALAQWVSREKVGQTRDATDYFLAGRKLPWWAIGASLIAANISAEQIIGMLASAGIDRSLMSAVGRGEREPRQPTADGVENPVNRRVEVLVR